MAACFRQSRLCGSSDYATRAYNYSEGTEPDSKLQRFSIDHDHEYILPILREARLANPSLWLLASAWSPPAWMKFNKLMLGGSMRRYWLGVYAQYFDRFLAEYAAAGVRVNSITPQNEVDTDQDGLYLATGVRDRICSGSPGAGDGEVGEPG